MFVQKKLYYDLSNVCDKYVFFAGVNGHDLCSDL